MNDMTVLFKQKQIILRFAEGIITNIYIKPSRISVIKKKHATPITVKFQTYSTKYIHDHVKTFKSPPFITVRTLIIV